MKIFKFFIVIFVLLIIYPVGYFVLESDKQINSKVIDKSVNVSEVIGAYIINLDSSKERYDYVKSNIDGLEIPVERISAVNGSSLSEEEIKAKVDLQKYKQFLGHSPKLGTIGCYLSHIKTWQAFIESNFEYAIIFEDDVSFDPIKLQLIIKELIKNNKDWDIASLEISHRGMPLTIKTFSDNQKLVIYLTEISHTGAYMINKNAAIQLLQKALPIKMPIDHYFTRAWEFDLKFTGIENPRVVYQTFGNSEINQTKNLSQKKVSMSASIKRGVYKLQSYLIRFLYNMKIYLINI